MSNHYFIAVQLNKEIKEVLASWQAQLRQLNELNYKSWTHPEDLHITLKFLGAVDDEKINVVKDKMLSIIDINRFVIKTNGLGTFGNETQPRVLWTGLQKSSELHYLQKAVESQCEQCGFSKENRPYRPHITLAKKWKGNRISPEFISDINTKFTERNELVVDSFVIYQIHPSRSQKYEVIQRVNLK